MVRLPDALFPRSDRIPGLVRRGLAVLAATATILAVAQGAGLTALVCLVVSVGLAWEARRAEHVSLSAAELDQLQEAELALASAADTAEAARQLAEHATSLLGARAAVVLIEGIGDTVRVAAGPGRVEDVYGSGSRMRLLQDAGLPCGSIAVAPRSDGSPYTARHERILDALAQGVSTTLHQLSLLTEVSTERRTLADLVGSSSDGIFSVGSDLRVRSWNPAMAAITGVDEHDAIGEHLSVSFRPTFEDGTPATGSSDPGRRGEPVAAVRLRIDAEDEVRWLTCSFAPLSDGGYVVIARDDTERKKLEDDKDGWIAQVSHELRTPLTPIKGFLQTLLRRDDQLTTADRRSIYELVLREEQRLENLVDSLLRSTQLDQGGLVVVPQRIDWPALATDQVAVARRADPSRTIDLLVAPDLPDVLADADMASGVLANLLSNACKYADAGSPIEVTVTATDGWCETAVVDHGPGVPRSDRQRIFSRFTRLGDHLTRPQQGVGLGLHIVKQSVEHLGGTVSVTDTPGGGATFTFTMPLADAPADAGASDGARRARRAPLRAPGGD